MCPESDKGDLAHFLGNVSDQWWPRKAKGLAAGLISVFAHFAAAGGERVIAFNSDSPHLPPSVLEGAFRDSLRIRDLVMGPTHDGGYYLVGAKAAHPTLFENDGLGTSSALERLLARAQALKLSSRPDRAFLRHRCCRGPDSARSGTGTGAGKSSANGSVVRAMGTSTLRASV